MDFKSSTDNWYLCLIHVEFEGYKKKRKDKKIRGKLKKDELNNLAILGTQILR